MGLWNHKVGDPEGGIAPGTAFEDIPEVVYLVCGVGKKISNRVERHLGLK